MLPSIGDYTVRCRCGPPCVSFECLRPEFAKPRGNVYADGQRNASEMGGRESSVSDQLVLGRRQFVDEDASTAFVVEDVRSSAESGDGGSAERPTGGGSVASVSTAANGPAVNSAADGEETVARRTGRGRDRTTSNEAEVAAAGTVRPGTARRAAAGDDEYADRSPPATRSDSGGGGREPSTPRAVGGRFTVDEAATADLRARSAGQPSTESSGTVADAEVAPPAEVGRRRRSAERPAARSPGDDAGAAIYVDRPAQTGRSSGRLLSDDEDARSGSLRQRPEDEDGRFPMPWDDDSYRGGERIAECRCRCATSEVGFYRAICDCYEDDDAASSASQRRQRCDMRQWKCAAGSFAVAGRRPARVTSSTLVVVD